MLTPEYVAGLFDGEGTVSIAYCKRRRWKTNPEKLVCGFRLVTHISNTHRKVLEMVGETIGGEVYGSSQKTKEHHKQVWVWRAQGRDLLLQFLLFVQPHCVIKARQVSIGLDYVTTIGLKGSRVSPQHFELRKRCYEELRALNERGQKKQPAHALPSIAPERFKPRRFYTEEELHRRMTEMRAHKVPLSG